MPCYVVKDGKLRKIINPKFKINNEIKQIKKIYVINIDENNNKLLQPVFILDNRDYTTDWEIISVNNISNANVNQLINYDNLSEIEIQNSIITTNLSIIKQNFKIKSGDKIYVNVGFEMEIDNNDDDSMNSICNLQLYKNNNTDENLIISCTGDLTINNNSYNYNHEISYNGEEADLIVSIQLEGNGSFTGLTTQYLNYLQIEINDKLILQY